MSNPVLFGISFFLGGFPHRLYISEDTVVHYIALMNRHEPLPGRPTGAAVCITCRGLGAAAPSTEGILFQRFSKRFISSMHLT